MTETSNSSFVVFRHHDCSFDFFDTLESAREFAKRHNSPYDIRLVEGFCWVAEHTIDYESSVLLAVFRTESDVDDFLQHYSEGEDPPMEKRDYGYRGCGTSLIRYRNPIIGALVESRSQNGTP